jgi:hypothetical protein
MQKNAKVGGILSIVAGAFGVLGLLVFVLIIIVMAFAIGESYHYDYSTQDEVYIFVFVFYGVLGLLSALVGVLAIVGGVFALRRKHWGWALAGSIAATLVFFPCGIPAIIFVSLGKPEFEALGPPAPAGPITG